MIDLLISDSWRHNDVSIKLSCSGSSLNKSCFRPCTDWWSPALALATLGLWKWDWRPRGPLAQVSPSCWKCSYSLGKKLLKDMGLIIDQKITKWQFKCFHTQGLLKSRSGGDISITTHYPRQRFLPWWRQFWRAIMCFEWKDFLGNSWIF